MPSDNFQRGLAVTIHFSNPWWTGVWLSASSDPQNGWNSYPRFCNQRGFTRVVVNPLLQPKPGGRGVSLRVFLPLAIGFSLLRGTRISPCAIAARLEQVVRTIWLASRLFERCSFLAFNKEHIVASALLTGTPFILAWAKSTCNEFLTKATTTKNLYSGHPR